MGKLHIEFLANTLFNIIKHCLLQGTEKLQFLFCVDIQTSEGIQVLLIQTFA